MARTEQRETRIDAFLSQLGWGDATRTVAAGDASFRSYDRVVRASGESAIVMDAPPEKEDVRPFLNVRAYYEDEGYRVPALYGADVDNGLLLLEDLGSSSFSQVLREHPEREMALYQTACMVLAAKVHAGAKGVTIPYYDHAVLRREAALLPEWFLPLVMGKGARCDEASTAFMKAFESVIDDDYVQPDVVVHRDFHADNLFWLAQEHGVKRVAMLDFQDALKGHPAYDVVSLLEDARRDVSPAVVEACLGHFIDATGLKKESFLKAYAFFGMQRNAKILGIFTRLCQRDGKPHYLAFVPRVWRLFLHDLEHPSNAPIKAWREQYITADMERLINNPTALKDFA